MTVIEKDLAESILTKQHSIGWLTNDDCHVETSEKQPLLVNQKRTRKLKYPIGVIFLLTSKFFESFSANGVRTVLALYLRDSLKFTESSATLILHTFNFFGQFCPIFGGIIADNYFGNQRTIFWFMFLYGFGWIGMILANIPIESVSYFVVILYLSLFLIGTGNGNIRGCITSMGAQQFQIPEQSDSLDRYFTHYIVLWNAGILLSKIVPPSVRANVQCFGQSDCYLAVFGVQGFSFFICWVVFLFGIVFYKKERHAKENVMTKMIGCIWHAAHRKLRGRIPDDQPWILGAVGPYSESFVYDVSTFLQILKLFLPLPIYWSLLTQVDSTWTFQATQLNTTLFGIRIEPDQTKAFGGIFLLTFIFIWTKLIEPMLRWLDIHVAPLNSIIAGGFFAILSFICAGLVQLKIDYNTGPAESILWQLPQYSLLMIAETLISIAGLKFTFKQAPESMKSVLTAMWCMNNAIGNLIVVLITEIRPIQSRSGEFFFYAALMTISIIIFMRLAALYNAQCRLTELQVPYMDEKYFSFVANQFGSNDTLMATEYILDKSRQQSCESLPKIF